MVTRGFILHHVLFAGYQEEHTIAHCKMTKQLTDRILEYLEKRGETNSLDLANEFREDHQKIIGAIKSLETVDDVSLIN